MSVSANLPERVYATIKRKILNGEIAPGARLLEKSLCEELKVSRTPVREALNRLGNEDLVLFRPHCGFLAAPLTADGARKLKDLRLIVESKVAALAALRATKSQIDALRDAAEMPVVIPGDDESFVRFCQANSRFHLLLTRTIDNQPLENIVMSALDQYQRPAYLGIGRVSDRTKATKCHHDIVDALLERDPFKAEAVMSGHVIGGSERIIKALVEAGL
ncbi:transcriptional regulator, GntR family protein [Verrucomicrobiia bacterium DG1235]|nr:transcriptional regulator, GntR family protein [Verrucomicrobiae bacterium DG1235]